MGTRAIQPERILCRVEARSKKHALEVLSALLAAGGTARTAPEIFAGLTERERLGSTSLGNGAAVPHSKDEAVGEPITALITLATPVDFDTSDAQAIDVLFGMLLPNGETSVDLGAVTEALRQPDCLLQLRRARSPAAVCEILAARLQKLETSTAVAEPG